MAKYPSFGTSYSTALMKLGLGDRSRPEEIFPRTDKKSFDDLKKEYTDKYGYIIKIPKLEDIFHLVPNALKSNAQIKAEKRQGLMNILASPQAISGPWNWYTTAMTWMDNIQDTGSIIYPAVSMLARWAPKAFGRLVPVFGWMMLGTDLLNWLLNLGRLNFTGMGGKRSWCDGQKHNPFHKTSQWLRKERIRNYKPGMADLIQVAQVTDQVTGFGISLGPVMGAAFDVLWGGYRYLKGDPVRFALDVPDMFEHEKIAGRGLAASGLINSFGQVFSEEMHFWSLLVGAISARIFTPAAHDFDIMGSVEDPMNVMVPAAIPQDPITIEVIREAGLNVEDGVRWPYNGQKEIALGDLWDELVPRNTQVFRDYCFRHSKDWYGYVIATAWDQVTSAMGFAFDPTGEVVEDDTTEMKALFKMVKAAILPTATVTQAQSDEFWEWVNGYRELYDEMPKIREIKDKLTQIKIPFKVGFPAERMPEADEFWPPDFPINDYTY
jgi:hypothetical protein